MPRGLNGEPIEQAAGEWVMPAPTPNIVLTGFSGAGKSTAGRRVAEVLGRRFIDIDDVIERRAGKSIADIFAQDGEPSFRGLEAATCWEFSEPQGLVIATGGGAALSATNLEALSRGGDVICLTAEVDTILNRLSPHEDRPLLQTEDRRERVSTLLAKRKTAYARVPTALATDGLSVAAVVERILGIIERLPEPGHRLRVTVDEGTKAGGGIPAYGAAMKSIPMSRSGYDVLIAPGLLAEAGRRLVRAGLVPGRCALITNPVVGSYHAAALMRSLEQADFEPLLIEAPDGEANKNLSTVSALYERLAEARLARNEPVVALGGGVTGDTAGFVASTWLRGVPFVQIPTSLLSMVDSSVGGKVGVDLAEGKNLVGAFKQPELVLIDPDLLSTLPPFEFRCGMAEIIKTALLGDPALFGRLEEEAPDLAGLDTVAITRVVADAVRVKADIVARDPYESSDRAWLNLGHTFGHALELVSNFSLHHGEGVGLGLIAASELSAALGLCAAEIPIRVKALVARTGLPVHFAFDIDAALAAMSTDKKRRGRTLRFIGIQRVGRACVTENVPESAIRGALAAIRAG